jgi:hypothetical protein
VVLHLVTIAPFAPITDPLTPRPYQAKGATGILYKIAAGIDGGDRTSRPAEEPKQSRIDFVGDDTGGPMFEATCSEEIRGSLLPNSPGASRR